jgi:tRNA threonylcarbamoyladenosine biosynthesis protein TsaB
MKILGIDTSGYVNAVGVTDGANVLADNVFPARTDSLEQIVANIDATLKSLGLSLTDIQGIGVGLGPGSWTGIRVGVTVGKMLAFSTGLPVVGVPTLEALAYSGRDKAPLVVAVVAVGVGDAVYAGLYRPEGPTVTRSGDYYIGDVRGLASLTDAPAAMVGPGATAYADMACNKFEALESLPSGAAVSALAGIRMACGEGDDALALTPLYLKESTAKAFVNKYAGD